MSFLFGYLANLSNGRIILWCYAIWYGVCVSNHFDPKPRLWVTSLGLSAIIGTALLISTRASKNGVTELDFWQIFRLYLMPLCVSSFSALVKDAGFLLVFPPSIEENLVGFGLIVCFVVLVRLLRRLSRRVSDVKAP